MSSTSVDLTFHTLHSTLPKGAGPINPEDVRKLFETALVEGGVWADAQPVLLQVMSGQPGGQSFTMSVAPQLAQPSFDSETLTVDTALALLSHLQTTLFQMNLVSNAMRAQIDSLTQQINLAQQRDDNLAAMDAQIKAREAGRLTEATDGAAMAGALLGAGIAIALAALFTGGLAIAVAGVAVTMAVLEMGTAIAKAAGAKAPADYNGQERPLDFTIAGMAQMSIDWEVTSGRVVVAEKRDGIWVDRSGNPIPDPTGDGVRVMTPTEFNNYYTYTGMAISLALGVGMMVGGFQAARMAGDLAKLTANVTKLNSLLGTSMSTRYVQQLGTAVEGATSFVEGSTNVVNGAAQVNLAVQKLALEKLNAALEHLQAQIDFLTQHMRLMQDIISKQAEAHNEATVATIRSIGEYYHAHTQIAHNVVHMS